MGQVCEIHPCSSWLTSSCYFDVTSSQSPHALFVSARVKARSTETLSLWLFFCCSMNYYRLLWMWIEKTGASVVNFPFKKEKDREGKKSQIGREPLVVWCRFPFVKHMSILLSQQRRGGWENYSCKEKDQGGEKVGGKTGDEEEGGEEGYWFDTRGITPQLCSFSFIWPCNVGVNMAGWRQRAGGGILEDEDILLESICYYLLPRVHPSVTCAAADACSTHEHMQTRLYLGKSEGEVGGVLIIYQT